MNKPDISIIIVSWNVKKLLDECLHSIFLNQKNLELEIFVVDNASSDNTAELIADKYPNAKLIANQTNNGFAKANNQALKQAQGENILLLNPDTLIRPENFHLALDFFKNNPKAGIMGCRHLNPDLSQQSSIRNFPSFLPIFLILTKLAKLIPQAKSLNKYFARNFDYHKTQPVDQPAGSYLLIRRQVFNEIGLLDEKFFYWFEEVDFCKRAKKSGWEIWYNNQPEIIHYGGQSFGQEMTLKKQIIFFKSAFHYFRKHGLKN